MQVALSGDAELVNISTTSVHIANNHHNVNGLLILFLKKVTDLQSFMLNCDVFLSDFSQLL
jgi:hypothetical protein